MKKRKYFLLLSLIILRSIHCSYFEQNKVWGGNECYTEYKLLQSDCYSYVVKLPLLTTIVFPPERSNQESMFLYYKLFDFGLLKCLEADAKKKECEEKRIPIINIKMDDIF